MIKGTAADIILTVYILGTLYLRFKLEASMENHPLISLALGLVMIGFIWALIKIKVLQPNYFGLVKKKTNS